MSHLTQYLKEEKNLRKVLLGVLSSLFLVILIRTAWISDDAAITFRSVLNLIHGFGPSYYIDERLQNFTHPLWFILLSIFTWIMRDLFYANLALSFICSLVAFVLIHFKISKNLKISLLSALAFLSSRAFVDYSTSGLENPLFHLMLAIGFFLIFEQKMILGVLILFTTYICRPDLVVLILPACIYVLWNAHKSASQTLKNILYVLLPCIVWTIFSVLYYGFPFPNTAYAKLSSGIPQAQMSLQGIRYLLDSLRNDPITLITISAGVIAGSRQNSLLKTMSLGITFHLIYVISIGGDFMSGRFLTAPFVAAGIVLLRSNISTKTTYALYVLLLLVGLKSIPHTFFSSTTLNNQDFQKDGIADERGFWFQENALLTQGRKTFATPQTWKVSESNDIYLICGQLGVKGLTYGPSARFVDACGLGDSLLARLPARYEALWRLGHYFRQVPTNYIESLQKNQNLLIDPKTKIYWDSLRTITRDPIFSAHRLQELVRFNLGKVEKPDFHMYRFEIIPSGIIPIEFISQNSTNIPFSSAVGISLGKPTLISSIRLTVSADSTYAVNSVQNGKMTPLFKINPTNVGEIAETSLKLDPPITTDTLLLVGISSDHHYLIQNLKINPN